MLVSADLYPCWSAQSPQHGGGSSAAGFKPALKVVITRQLTVMLPTPPYSMSGGTHQSLFLA